MTSASCRWARLLQAWQGDLAVVTLPTASGTHDTCFDFVKWWPNIFLYSVPWATGPKALFSFFFITGRASGACCDICVYTCSPGAFPHSVSPLLLTLSSFHPLPRLFLQTQPQLQHYSPLLSTPIHFFPSTPPYPSTHPQLHPISPNPRGNLILLSHFLVDKGPGGLIIMMVGGRWGADLVELQVIISAWPAALVVPAGQGLPRRPILMCLEYIFSLSLFVSFSLFIPLFPCLFVFFYLCTGGWSKATK